MKTWNRSRLPLCLASLLIIAVVSALGLFIRKSFIDIRRRETDYILHFYSENILLQLRSHLNETDALARMSGAIEEEGTDWFRRAAMPLLEREEVRLAGLFRGDTVVCALPEELYGSRVGLDLKDFSYIYTMAKVTKDFAVEGPVVLDYSADGEEVFLFLKPIVKNDSYLGEVVVALDSDYVMEQLGLGYLSERGYDYELWRVDPQNGGKEIIAVSRSGVDFSHAAKTTFYLPTQWNLSVQPADGWVSAHFRITVWLLCLFMAGILLTLTFLYDKYRKCSRKLKQAALRDNQTGLYNQTGFTLQLNRWLEENSPIMLFYFVFEGYNQVAQLIGPKEEEAFLKAIPAKIDEFTESPYLAGRLESGNFAVAVREEMDEEQQGNFARGLSLELLLKTHLNGERFFLNARYQFLRCQAGPGEAEAAVAGLIHAYYTRILKESPVRMLTEKCRQLMEGHSDVVFNEYTDLEMMELSKTFNQYRKQVEQLAYFDQMFNVGNRQKYFRDANMLISYDKKRQFHLYCVDICEFSQYNELFSAEVGDRILQEVINRLNRLFGTYLYRINGDVFLGISLSNEREEEFADKLQKILNKPATIGSASLALKVRIVVCQYPRHGGAPEVLLEHIQSAVRYAKENNRKIVVYNDELDELFRTETDILHRLKSGIRENTLEVWYQPMMHLESGEFTAVEALVRLPNGQGGYFSAGQVISLAERSSMAEDVGDYVTGCACRFMKRMGEKLGLTHMSINLSVQQLLLDNSAGHLLDIIGNTGVSLNQITLEITESILIQSIDQASAALDKIREIGIRVALDDFGVGYSSLNYLSNLPVDVIKIDRSLTKQILTNPKQRALLHSIVEMAEINSLTVVVEGCETDEEREIIAASGIQFIQGYYYARPMPEDELIRFLGN
ncbi:EAL domain-containing protein [Clostridium sp. MCC353]|uniref:bifunctional diguanylate cyclase/phosphodiesterase n=1 Tax=Clostridium sp. MCC353 TaxID=2592646 RepID=UPI001C020BEF|nr:GGDEF domain-containing phosphodiesterase [Clostridium sp. MCC353]MBT9776442.1 EAL domain-containing protein [Clostridium sp. MCC353]